MDPPRIRLRDVTLEDADLLEAWDNPADQGEYNDFGQEPSPAPREVMALGPLRNEYNGLLMVELVADATPIGTVSWHRVMNGPNPESNGWNVGIFLVPEARGHGYGAEAQRQLAAYLFETTSVNRVEAATDVDNLAEQRSLEKAGYQRDGVLRGAQFRAGSYHDLVVFSRLRDDPA